MNPIIDEIGKGYLKEFKYNEFQIIKRISDGSSEVFLAYMETNHKHVVIKFLKCNQDECEYYKKFRREIANLKKIFQNDNVNGFYGVTKDPLKKFHSMVLQFFSDKNLREHLKEEKGEWFYKKQMATEIATDIKKLKTFLALENREVPIHLTPVDYKELYCDSWNSDPEKRPSINEVINRLKDIEFDCLYQDSDYIPEISLGSSFRNIIQFTSNNAACLEVIKGSALNLYIFLPPGEISVGRSNSNDVIIKDNKIARKHARIIVNNQGQVEINELGSDYGTFINGKKLDFRTSCPLTKDDVISMGHSEFQYLPIGEYKNRIDEPLLIYNKTYFSKKLENVFKNSKENKRDLSLLFFDLDHFKSINDQNDHLTGDYALKELANLIQKNHVRSEDIFARYGGDEFTILLKDADINLASKIAEEIRASVEGHPFIYNETQLSVTLSIGVSEMNSSVKTFDELLLYADNASKKAKEYRNRVVIWNNGLNSILETENHLNKFAEYECYPIESPSSTMDYEIGITIIKSDSENKRPEYTFLSQNKTLNFIRIELKMGTNCYFIRKKNGARISRKDESKLNLLQIIETSDNEYFLYMEKEISEFDLLQLEREKGFKFDTDGSIENAKDKAFKIDISKIEPPSDPRCDRKDKTYKCEHAPSTNCKRNLIIDGKFSAALEWFCNSLKLFRTNSEKPFNSLETSTMHSYEWRPKKEIIISGIIATDEFIRDVKAALKSNGEDIIKQLRDVSEKYGHFYAHRLVLGYTVGEDGFSIMSLFRPNTNVENAVHGDNTDISNSVNVIGGNKDKYFQNGMKSWNESLEDVSTWKIIGYDKIYSLFELLEKDLQKEVLSALGHRILKAGTEDIPFELKGSINSIPPYIHNLSPHIKEVGHVHNYQVFASIMNKSDKNLFSAHIDYVNKDKNTPVIVVHNIKKENSSSTIYCPIKLGWIIVGPLTNFDFSIQFPLAFRSMKQMASIKENHCTVKINNYKTCIFGICALEADSQSSSISNTDATRKENSQLSSASSVSSSESTEIIPYNIEYDPRTVEFVVGTHFSTYKDSACLFVYNLKDIDKPVDKEVLQNLALYTCVVDVDNHEKFNFGQRPVTWKSSKQEKISYAKIAKIESEKLSNNDLILVSQLFNNCPNCKRGFVNVNSNTGQVIYKSLSSDLLDSVENIAYLLISSVNKN
ncbi:8445_t:CDS:2 [Dentiscutata erythropus]|uniref:8445_t:CDS:1 n=1 Tax=Dentiscutata erythropus TaxID=1348616 RepID=A0A9N9DD77_9GLOM|nr:8445_t:CDS:2 [Dentiscutata erythropus]